MSDAQPGQRGKAKKTKIAIRAGTRNPLKPGDVLEQPAVEQQAVGERGEGFAQRQIVGSKGEQHGDQRQQSQKERDALLAGRAAETARQPTRASAAGITPTNRGIRGRVAEASRGVSQSP